MRFAHLNLLRYGGFADRHYDFTSSPVDLQVLHGANEAGKSTTLQAISDLLFGFTHIKTQDWHFDATQLRVGARLEQNGEQLDIIRKRGTKQTLLAADGTTPFDVNRLIRWLGGTDRTDFERMWSLDHQRLRIGGEAMAHFGDDLGKQLLTAGFGLENVQVVLNALEAEAGALWKSRGRGTKLHELRNRLDNARSRLSVAEKSSQNWSSLHHEASTIEDTLKTLQHSLKAAFSERDALKRIRRLRDDLNQHAQFSAALEASARPLFSEQDHIIFNDLIGQLRTCERQLDIHKSRHDHMTALRAGCRPDMLLLAHGDKLDSFQTRFARLEAVRDLQSSQEQDLEALDLILRARGQKGSFEAIIDSLPDQTLLAALRPIAARYDNLTRQEAEEDKTLAAARENLTLAQAHLDTTCAPALEPLSVALQQAGKRDNIDDDLGRLQRQHTHATITLAQALRDLTPWQGTIEVLQDMAVPESGLLDDTCTTWRERQKARDTVSGELEKVRHNTARQDLAKTQLEQRKIVSLATLVEARAQRDTLLDAVIRTPHDQTAHSRFLEAQHHADTLADRRFEDAEESAKLTQIEQEMERLKLEESQLIDSLSVIDTEQDNARTIWQKELVRRALPMLDPAHLRGWISLRTHALSADTTMQEINAELKELDARRSMAFAALHTILPDLPAFDTLSDAVVWAQARQSQWLKEAGSLAKTKSDIEQAQYRLNSELKKSELRIKNRVDLQRQWASLVTSRPNMTIQSADTIDALIELCRTAKEANHLYTHLGKQKQEATALEADFIYFANSLARDDRLALRSSGEKLGILMKELETARADRGKAQSYDSDLMKIAYDLQQAQKELDTVAAQFTEFSQRALGPVSSEDAIDTSRVETLRILFNQEKSWYETQKNKKDIEQRIAGEHNAPDLITLQKQARQWSDSMIELRIDEIDRECDETEKQRDDSLNRRGEINIHLRHIEQAHDARDAALDIETCRTEMTNAAETWASIRIQTLILTRMAQRQRDENTNPLLKSAESFFSALTCGRYQKLTVAEDGKAPALAALLKDKRGERLIRPTAMSEGTRDQLFLSLRLAAIEQARERGVTLPFIADDLFITFDEARAKAGFATLARLAQQRQIMFLTHHAHLADMAGTFGALRHSV